MEIRPIPGYSRYLAREDGVFIEKENGHPLNPWMDRLGEMRIILTSDIWKQTRMRAARLILSAFKPLASRRDEDWASVIFKDRNRRNLSVRNLRWDRNFVEPPSFEGVPQNTFFPIPDFTSYEVNRLGVIRNRHTKTPVALKSDGKGYVTARLLSDQANLALNCGVHRAIALVFLPHPKDTDRLVPNHIDSNPRNNNLSNLEWVTYGGNAMHAYLHGNKRFMLKGVEAMEIETRSIVQWASMNECARRFRINPGMLNDLLIARASTDKIRREFRGYFLRYINNDPIPWPPASAKVICENSASRTMVKDLWTGEVTTHDSLTKAALEVTGSARSASHFMMNNVGLRKKPVRGRYVVRTIPYDGKVVWPEYSDSDIARFKAMTSNIGIPVKVTNLKTGDVQMFGSIIDFARKTPGIGKDRAGQCFRAKIPYRGIYQIDAL